MKWPAAGLLLGLVWACPVCDLALSLIVPLAGAWSIGRWGADLPARLFGRRARPAA